MAVPFNRLKAETINSVPSVDFGKLILFVERGRVQSEHRIRESTKESDLLGMGERRPLASDRHVFFGG